MSAEDRVRWDRIYRQQETYPDPDPLLLQFTPPVEDDKEHRALDLAGGLGQNGLWLAEQGYSTDIMDISRVALQKARAQMAIRNLRNVNLLQVDMDTLELDEEIYDIICVFRYLKREIFPKIKAAVVPGGRVIYQTFNMRYLDIVPGFNRAFLLEVGELAGCFNDWKILCNEESDHNTMLIAVKSK
jgi:SAM-dependent methyltransferase